jgi:AcrR family transcriptional regulator
MHIERKAARPVRKGSPWRADPLPRGRHGLSARAVRESQRARLLRATLELIARQGYAGTTVPEVVAAARVSRNAFYEHFADKEACFLALCAEEAAELSDAVLAASFREKSWAAALRSGIRATLQWWRERPQFARTYFVEMPGAGPRAVEQRERAYRPFEDMFRQLGAWARRGGRRNPALRNRIPQLLIIAITEMIAVEVRAGRVAELLEIEDDLVHATSALLAP